MKAKKKQMAKEAKTLLQWQMTKRAERERGSKEKELQWDNLQYEHNKKSIEAHQESARAERERLINVAKEQMESHETLKTMRENFKD